MTPGVSQRPRSDARQLRQREKVSFPQTEQYF
nr:MAG TPA: hypothetical protein [Caudoviricetes sp.]